MKFLITCRPLTPTPLPVEQAIARIEAAVAWCETRLAAGTLETTYLFPDRGGFAVLEAASAGHLMETLLAYPAYPLYTWQVQPLIEWRTGFERILDHLRGTAKEAGSAPPPAGR